MGQWVIIFNLIFIYLLNCESDYSDLGLLVRKICLLEFTLLSSRLQSFT